MQAEAGQLLNQIVVRKELERQAGGGIFTWGVGNAPALAARTLSRLRTPVQVVFSIMKSKPKLIDVAPVRTLVWRSYLDADGVERPLPPASLVTSRADSARGTKSAHYALMCSSNEPLRLEIATAGFDPAAFRNVGGTRSPVGASQVTALLVRVQADGATPEYRVNMSAKLAGGYWVKLTNPIEQPVARLSLLDEVNEEMLAGDWVQLVTELRQGASAAIAQEVCHLLL